MSVIDLLWKNVEDCRYVVPLQDALHWCGANTDKCIHKQDLIQRLQDNAVDIFMTLWDLYSVVTRDKSCESDNATLDAIGKATYDLSKLYSEQLGFDYSLDAEKEVSHESIKTQFMEVYDTAKATWPAVTRCPFRDWFDKIHAVKHAIRDELRDDKQELKKMWHHVVNKVLHKEKRIQKHI